MRICLAAVLVAILAGSAYAQSPQSQSVRPGLNLPVGGDKPAATVDPGRETEYKSAIEKIPDKKVDDPWSGVRSDANATPSKTSKARKTDR